jgi:hypothetical protein
MKRRPELSTVTTGVRAFETEDGNDKLKNLPMGRRRLSRSSVHTTLLLCRSRAAASNRVHQPKQSVILRR